MIVDRAQAAALTDALDLVVAKAAETYGVRADAELHGFNLFQGSGDWACLPPRVRIGVYNQAFDAIAKHGAKVILRGVHRRGLQSRYQLPRQPHEVVLQHLLERIDEYTTVWAWRDYRNTQAACRKMEKHYGLHQVGPAPTSRSPKATEFHKANRQDHDEVPRDQLHEHVHAAAQVATDMHDFTRQLQAAGVWGPATHPRHRP